MAPKSTKKTEATKPLFTAAQLKIRKKFEEQCNILEKEYKELYSKIEDSENYFNTAKRYKEFYQQCESLIVSCEKFIKKTQKEWETQVARLYKKAEIRTAYYMIACTISFKFEVFLKMRLYPNQQRRILEDKEISLDETQKEKYEFIIKNAETRKIEKCYLADATDENIKASKEFFASLWEDTEKLKNNFIAANLPSLLPKVNAPVVNNSSPLPAAAPSLPASTSPPIAPIIPSSTKAASLFSPSFSATPSSLPPPVSAAINTAATSSTTFPQPQSVSEKKDAKLSVEVAPPHSSDVEVFSDIFAEPLNSDRDSSLPVAPSYTPDALPLSISFPAAPSSSPTPASGTGNGAAFLPFSSTAQISLELGRNKEDEKLLTAVAPSYPFPNASGTGHAVTSSETEAVNTFAEKISQMITAPLPPAKVVKKVEEMVGKISEETGILPSFILSKVLEQKEQQLSQLRTEIMILKEIQARQPALSGKRKENEFSMETFSPKRNKREAAPAMLPAAAPKPSEPLDGETHEQYNLLATLLNP